MDKKRLVVGIDEVGRGPLAGPVAVGAFIVHKKIQLPIKDSKKLTEKQREIWYEKICEWRKEWKCDFCVTMVSAKIVDKIGLSKAIQKALNKSLNLVLPKSHDSAKRVKVLLDGGLRAPAEFKNQKTIIKGDEKEPVIALASIVAKVMRDRYMKKIAKKYPQYYFEIHKGYGTKKHYIALKKYGISPLHRKSFLKNL